MEGQSGAQRDEGVVEDGTTTDAGPARPTPSEASRLADVVRELGQTLEQAILQDLDPRVLLDMAADLEHLAGWAAAGVRRVASALDSTLPNHAFGMVLRGGMRGLGMDAVGKAAVAELAPRLGISPMRAARLIADGNAFEGVLGEVGTALSAGLIDMAKARCFVQLLEEHPPEVIFAVLERVLPLAPGLTHGPLRARINREIIAVSEAAAAAAATQARRGRHLGGVKVMAHGMARMTLVAPLADVVAVHTVCEASARAARTGGDPRTLQQLRADALVTMAATALTSGRLDAAVQGLVDLIRSGGGTANGEPMGGNRDRANDGGANPGDAGSLGAGSGSADSGTGGSGTGREGDPGSDGDRADEADPGGIGIGNGTVLALRQWPTMGRPPYLMTLADLVGAADLSAPDPADDVPPVLTTRDARTPGPRGRAISAPAPAATPAQAEPAAPVPPEAAPSAQPEAAPSAQPEAAPPEWPAAGTIRLEDLQARLREYNAGVGSVMTAPGSALAALRWVENEVWRNELAEWQRHTGVRRPPVPLPTSVQGAIGRDEADSVTGQLELIRQGVYWDPAWEAPVLPPGDPDWVAPTVPQARAPVLGAFHHGGRMRLRIAERHLRHGPDPQPGLADEIATDLYGMPESAEPASAAPPPGTGTVSRPASPLGCGPGGSVLEPELLGYGPLDPGTAQLLALSPPPFLAVLPADPPAGDADPLPPESGYVPSARLAARVRAQHPVCVAPFCAVPAVSCDLDHVVNWPQGSTVEHNLRPLCRRHHNLKTHGGHSYHLDQDGAVHWRTPLGQRLIRGLDGHTRRIARAVPSGGTEDGSADAA